MNKSDRLFFVGLIFLTIGIAGFLVWKLCPAISPFFFGSAVGIEFFALLLFFLIYTLWRDQKGSYNPVKDSFSVSWKLALGVGVLDCLVLFFSWCPLIHWSTRYNQLGNGNVETIEEISFQEMIGDIDNSQLPIIDESTASVIAQNLLGDSAGLGSSFKLGKGNKININGQITWCFLLEHSGHFEWKERPSSPGFITVNASDVKDAHLHLGYNILYSKTSSYSYNLLRYLRAHGFLSVGLTEMTFEVTDDLEPMQVITTYKNLTGWLTREATGVVVLDPQTGEYTQYSMNDIPEWVDIVQPEKFIEDQIELWGRYVHGVHIPFVHSGHTDEFKKTDQMMTVHRLGEAYYFTGLTNISGDKSLKGFLITSTKNKKAYLCNMGGINEDAAMEEAEKRWSNYDYEALEPLPTVVDGEPTFAVPVSSEKSKTISGYAMINIKNQDIGAIGATVLDAANAYSMALSDAGLGYVTSPTAHSYDVEGIISRISSEVKNGNTYYTLVLEGNTEEIYTCGFNISSELAITRDGDRVQITYINDGNGTFSIRKFDNLAYTTIKSESQERRDEIGDEVSDEHTPTLVDPQQNAEWWDSLSEEEKADIMSNQEQ